MKTKAARKADRIRYSKTHKEFGARGRTIEELKLENARLHAELLAAKDPDHVARTEQADISDAATAVLVDLLAPALAEAQKRLTAVSLARPVAKVSVAEMAATLAATQQKVLDLERARDALQATAADSDRRQARVELYEEQGILGRLPAHQFLRLMPPNYRTMGLARCMHLMSQQQNTQFWKVMFWCLKWVADEVESRKHLLLETTTVPMVVDVPDKTSALVLPTAEEVSRLGGLGG